MTLERLATTRPSRVFAITWTGQLISVIGSGLSSFALGVEILGGSGSVTGFTLFYFFYFLPLLLLSPVAGALVDRWDRRWAMLLSDLGGGLCTALIWLLIVASEAGHWPFQTWHFYVPIALRSAFGALRLPAYYATTTLLVPKRHLGRANGLIELATGAQNVVAPVLAATLMSRIGLRGIVLLDVATFIVSVGTLLLVRFPRPPPTEQGLAGRGSIGQEIAYGWRFIRERPGLMGLLLFTTVMNIVLSSVTVLLAPLVLKFADVSTLGKVQSVAGVGMVLGGIVMSVWGGGRRRMDGILGSCLLAGSVLFLAGLPASAVLIGLAAAVFVFSAPLMIGSSHAIWQSKVAPDLQGRIFSVRRMISLSAPPLASLVAGPLADRFFEPWMDHGGALATTVGRVMGTGPGRGIALMYVLLGVLTIANVIVASLSQRLRRLEEELPDAVPDKVTPKAAA